MCWLNNMATPIVLKKPLRVYKVGTPVNLRKPRVHRFISLYQDFIYCKCKTMPTIEINLEFTRYASDVGIWAHFGSMIVFIYMKVTIHI